MPPNHPSASSVELALLTNDEFAARWTALVGEPPAIMLQDRAQMVRLLVESMAAEASPILESASGTGRPRKGGAMGTRPSCR
ncbi:hypothetical protein KHHGKMAE_4511 [Methylobacterium persicinum]|nr:hypothetical protein KHHGKMAE_4511 [Methylobacterium persicinum]